MNNQAPYQKQELEHHPLQPFLPPNAQLLMLGSFPPQKKRWCMEFFYPNRTNQMWEIFGVVFFGDSKRLVEGKGFRKSDIVKLLEEKGIAIFDTAQTVIRLADNASDKFLEVVEKTDVASLLHQIPLCQDIVCTGQKSAEILCQDFGGKIPAMGECSSLTIDGREMRLWRMPSSSRAYPMKLEEKASYYKMMMRRVLKENIL